MLSPQELLERLHELEQEAKRERIVRWGPRTLDLDILFYDDCVIDTRGTSHSPYRLAESGFCAKADESDCALSAASSFESDDLSALGKPVSAVGGVYERKIKKDTRRGL